MDIRFTTSDVLLLVAIAAAYDQGRRGASLRAITYTGDYLELYVFTAQELRRGMAKLTSAGYVREVRGRFALTPAGRDLVAWRGSKSSREVAARVFERLSDQLSAFDAPADSSRFEDPDWPYPGITDEAVAKESA